MASQNFGAGFDPRRIRSLKFTRGRHAQPLSLVRAQAVVRQQPHGIALGQFAQHFAQRVQALVVVVLAGYQRHADPDFRGFGRQRMQIIENKAVRHAGQLPVPLVVRVFHVVQYEVAKAGRLEQILGLCVPAGVQRSVDAPAVQGSQAFGKELRLDERLAARKRDAASGLLIRSRDPAPPP